MKKAIVTILFFLVGFAYAEPESYKIIFHLDGGEIKTFKYDEIDSININTLKAGYLMKIFFNQTETADYTAKEIESIKFVLDKDGKLNLLVFVSGSSDSYLVNQIDSIRILYSDQPVPKITEMQPTIAKLGDILTITGSNFGNSQDNGYVGFKGINAKTYISWNDTEIKLNIPRGAVNGMVFVLVNNVKSNEKNLKIIPQIVQLSSDSGFVDVPITIKGMGFGLSQANAKIIFNTVEATNITSWGDSSIVVKVPKKASTGKIYVISEGIESNQLDFKVLPSIWAIDPPTAKFNNEISISGTSFGTAQNNSKVLFNKVEAVDYTNWSDTLIIVKVPIDAKSGKVSVNVNGSVSNEVDFNLVPIITKITPDSAGISSEIVLTGQGFGDEQNQSFISFNDVKATGYLSWSDTSVTITVPPDIITGKVSITVAGYKSNEVDFTLIHHITSINPSTLKIGDNVTITGTNFNLLTGQKSVLFNEIVVTNFESWENKEIIVEIPPNAQSGTLSVKVGNVRSNAVPYSVIPKITSIDPTSGYINSTVIITGTSFGSTKGTSEVFFNSANATEINQWTNTELSVKVPEGAKTGKVFVKAGNVNSNEIDFTILPSIISINPNSGLPGETISIKGVSFGDTKGTSIVTFTGADVSEYLGWTDSEIKVKVPPDAITGKMYVTVNQVKSNEVDFSLRSYISSINPTSGSVGDFVMITGTGFGITRENNKVTFFNNKDATEYQSWSNTQIIVKVPPGAETGNLYVSINSVKSNEVNFTINP